MARNHANGRYIYRAVIVETFADGRTVTSMYGPYDTRGAAKCRITSAESGAAKSLGPWRNPEYAYSAVGHIERAEVVWMCEA